MSTVLQPPEMHKGKRAATAFSRSELINRAAVRRFALDAARQAGRGDVITRVGNDVYIDCDRVLRDHLRGLVSRHPSAFRTLETN